MKRFTLFSITIFLFASAKAQITKGSTFLGGSVNFSSDKSSPSRTTDVETINSNWGIRPQIGKTFRDNKVAGIFFDMGGSVNKQSRAPSDLSQTKNSIYGGGVFLRNYFSIANRFYLFGDASFGIASIRNENLFDNGTTRFIAYSNKGIQTNLSLAPGISFAASKNVHLEAAFNKLLSLTYCSGKSEEYTSPAVLYRETKTKNFTASANANAFNGLFLGIRFILP